MVSGPAGVEVAIPESWSVRPGAIPSNQQADAPDGSGLVRFGGSPAPVTTLLDTVIENETGNPNVLEGYQRLRLEPVYGYGTEAVDWEFTFVKDGEFRHGRARFWRTNGIEYVVYASAEEVDWPSLVPVIETMIATAQPR